jgi:hypothetical protein
MADDNPRLKLVREDLQTQITDVYASPGTILIIHPKKDVKFNPDFSVWLARTLETLLPTGVRGIVLSENVADFEVLKPTDGDDHNGDYRQGWDDAIEAIVEILK